MVQRYEKQFVYQNNLSQKRLAISNKKSTNKPFKGSIDAKYCAQSGSRTRTPEDTGF
jgi:putative salt-induced outer membrane protein YdiY